jgi:hypothetical protein
MLDMIALGAISKAYMKGAILDAELENLPKEEAYAVAKSESTIKILKGKKEAYAEFDLKDVIKIALIEGQLSGSVEGLFK